MSVTICHTPTAQFHLNISHPFPTHKSSWLPTHEPGMMQSQNPDRPPAAAAPYIHPLVRQSMIRMNHNSLEMCTECLGSESGCSDFNDPGCFAISASSAAEETAGHQEGFTEVTNDSYHLSSRRYQSKSFPPPLQSISRRDGSFIQMRSHRCNGRLVLEAVPVASNNLLHACRLDGHLLLYFVDTEKRIRESIDTMQMEEQVKEPEDVNDVEKCGDTGERDGDALDDGEKYVDAGETDGDALEYEEEEEEEVEVVDRGTVVEVKVSTQKQHQSDTKVLRSSIMINKFVGGAPLSNEKQWAKPPSFSTKRRMPPATTTSVAVAVAESSVSALASMEIAGKTILNTKSKLLFTFKRRNREEMLHNMRRCCELRRPLFFWEPCCIAAAS